MSIFSVRWEYLISKPLPQRVRRRLAKDPREAGGRKVKRRKKVQVLYFSSMSIMTDFQSYAGPGDKSLRNTELEGHQPVSRIGEKVINSFVDSFEFSLLKEGIKKSELTGTQVDVTNDIVVEYRPMFHEWATVQPGMICIARKKRTAVFRQFTAAETAVPVISCAACIPKADEKNYYYVGIARSKSVRDPADGIGPTQDEYFTLSIGGMATLLNTSGDVLHPGDLIEWTLTTENMNTGQRPRAGPRRVAVQLASVSSPNVIGRVLSFAKAGESFDVLLKE